MRTFVFTASIVVLITCFFEIRSMETRELGKPIRGTWLFSQWLNTNTEKQIHRLSDDLMKYDMNRIYPLLNLESKSEIPGSDQKIGWVKHPEIARSFCQAIRTRIPGIKIIPFKGVRTCAISKDNLQETTGLPFWQNDERMNQEINALFNSMDVMGADGIQYDLECAEIDDPEKFRGFDMFLKRLKQKIGKNHILSIAIPVIKRNPLHFDELRYKQSPWLNILQKPKRYADMGRMPHVFESIYTHADEVCLMLYDTWMGKEPEEFLNLIADQAWINAWYSNRFGATFLPGIRLSTETVRSPMHVHSIENPTQTIRGIQKVITNQTIDRETVGDHIGGYVIYRLDIQYDKSWNNSIGSPYLQSLEKLARKGFSPSLTQMVEPLNSK